MTTFDVTLRDRGAFCTARFDTLRGRAWYVDHIDALTIHSPRVALVRWPDLSRLVACWIADGLTIKGP